MFGALEKRLIPAGAKLRVLVVDDSVVIRRLVTHALSEDPMIEVVGSAANGAIALQRIPQVNPDAITLDIEMPEMDGIAALRQIRQLYPNLCVIMFSTLTERGAASTLEALSAGANDYVTKASNLGSLDRSLENLRGELIPKIRQFFAFESAAQPCAVPKPPVVARTAAAPITKPPVAVPGMSMRRQAVVLGISTGGPTALAELIPMLPKDFRLPILIVQHMPPMFTRLLAERLQASCKLQVREATDGMPVAPGSILIAPGDHHMRVVRKGTSIVAALDQGPHENSCRPAADVLFRSAAEMYGGGCIAAVLTGMGQDGLRGTEVLRAKGAYVIAQDEQTSVVWGMPGFVVRAGLADAVLPLKAIVPEILKQAVN